MPESLEILFNLLLFLAIVGLVIFIARKFIKLGNAYQKNKFLSGTLGVVGFIIGIWIGAIIEFLLKGTSPNSLAYKLSDFIRFPAGLLLCWAFYRFLNMAWSKDKS